MSVQAISWAMAQAMGTPGEKLLLIVIANAADPDGVTKIGRKLMAVHCSCEPETVSRNMAKLIAGGYVEKVERRRENGSRTSDWTILAPRARDRGMMVDADRDEYAETVWGVARTTSGDEASPDLLGVGQVTSSGGPDPSGDPESSSSSRGERRHPELPGEVDMDARELLKRKMKVGGRIVTEEEMGKAAAAIKAFNAQAGSSFGLGAHVTPVVGRIRERPTYDADALVRLVESAWRLRWWERGGRSGRRATPAVIFGNTQCFENVVQDAVDEKKGKPAQESRPGRFGTGKPPEGLL